MGDALFRRPKIDCLLTFLYSNAFLGSLAQRRAHRHAHDTLDMSSDAADTDMTDVSGDIATVTTSASLVETQAAIPGLPDHLVIAHILRSEYFDDPADLARLPAVTCAMCAAVAATGLRLEKLSENGATQLG